MAELVAAQHLGPADTAPAKPVRSRFGAAEDAGEETADDPISWRTAAEASILKLGSFAVMNRTIDIAQAALARHQLATYPLTCSSRFRARPAAAWISTVRREVIDIGHELAAWALTASAQKLRRVAATRRPQVSGLGAGRYAAARSSGLGPNARSESRRRTPQVRAERRDLGGHARAER